MQVCFAYSGSVLLAIELLCLQLLLGAFSSLQMDLFAHNWSLLLTMGMCV